MGSRILAKKTHTEAYWELLAPQTLLRCTASYVTTGERCRSEAVASGVCDKHGARLPVVAAAAALRIGESAKDMVELLLTWVNDPTVDMKERTKIAMDMLDRSGHGATSKHLHGVVTGGDALDTLLMDLISTPGMLVDPAQPAAAKAPPTEWDRQVTDDPRVIPGEVVRELPRYPARAEEPPARPKTPAHIQRALDQLL